MKKIILTIALFTAGCSTQMPGLITFAEQQPQATQQIARPTATTTPTATIVPTATLNIEATMVRIAETQNALTTLLIAPTQTHEALLLAQSNAEAAEAAANVEIERMRLEAAAMQYAAQQTQVAADNTARPLTQVAFATMAPLIKAQQELEANEPARMREINEAQQQADWGWAAPVSTLAISMTLLITMSGLIAYVLRRPAPEQQEQPFILPSELQPIPMMPTASNPSYTVRSEFPCTPEQMVELARGYINEGKPLGFRRWIGSPVFPALRDIREKLKELELAYELEGMAGQMEYTEQGKELMRYTAREGRLPDGYTCAIQSPPLSQSQP